MIPLSQEAQNKQDIQDARAEQVASNNAHIDAVSQHIGNYTDYETGHKIPFGFADGLQVNSDGSESWVEVVDKRSRQTHRITEYGDEVQARRTLEESQKLTKAMFFEDTTPKLSAESEAYERDRYAKYLADNGR